MHDLPDGMNCAYGRISGAVVQRFNLPIVLRLMNRLDGRRYVPSGREKGVEKWK